MPLLKKWLTALVAVLSAVALTACTDTRTDRVPYSPANFAAPDPVPEVSQTHRISPSDIITISVYRAPEVSGDFRVDGAGNIAMPLIGQVHAQGATADELAAKITDQLGRSYYERPNVSVAVKETPGQQITIDGAVGAPGVYKIGGKTTLMQAVAMAKGTTQDANLRRVVVFRQINGQRMAAGFDLRAIRTAEMDDPEVFASDIIIVDGNSVKTRMRDIMSTIPLLSIFRPF